MTFEDLVQLLLQFNLKRVGEIKLNDKNHLAFNLTHSTNDEGHVYTWVECSPDSARVVYVGMAGDTLRKRCKQHENGFRNSKPGKGHANRIRHGLGKSCQYFVFARKSAMSNVLSIDNIPMQAVEELALIKRFDPKWNKQGRR